MRTSLLISLSFLLYTNAVFTQQTINVPSDVSTIQEALNNADEGTTILVATGTYSENLIWPRNIDGIKLIGEGGAENTIIDGGGVDRCIIIDGNGGNDHIITSETLIEGFTIQNGFVNDEDGDANLVVDDGAGLYLVNVSPTLRNLIIQENHGEGFSVAGGGLCARNFGGIIKDCQFINNTLATEELAKGAGLFLEAIENANIESCTFENNLASSLFESFGGGVYLSRSSLNLNVDTLVIPFRNCIVNSNTINSTYNGFAYGAGISIADPSILELFIVEMDNCQISNNNVDVTPISYGGGIHVSDGGSLLITNSDINNNYAETGAGIYFASHFEYISHKISNTSISENRSLTTFSIVGAIYVSYNPLELTLENCLISYNESSSIVFNTGAIWDQEQARLNLYNCTIAHNSSFLEIEDTELNVYNSILWNNGGEEILDDSSEIPSEININHSIVRGGYLGIGVIDADPLFISEDLLVPSNDSPCLSNGTLVNASDRDFWGNPRPLPANSPPDIGCYEVDQYFAHVWTKFYFDENENGVKDNDERYVSFGAVKVEGDKTYNNFRPEGIFVIVDQGPLTITYDMTVNKLWQASGQSTFNFDVDSDDFSSEIEIGLFPKERIFNLSSHLESDRFRCGEDIDFTLTVVNYGTVPEAGIVALQLDDRLDNFSFEIEPGHEVGDHIVEWNVPELYPQEAYQIRFTVMAPLIESADQIGELYIFKYRMLNIQRDAPNCYEVELRCAFDPNDKLVTPNRADSLALLDELLFYKIRFQNTGNDYARNVSVLDTLDKNLDLQTFKLINTSHPDHLLISFDENIINFNFPNIYLPDSTTNEPGSNGFVSFSIATVDGLPLETEINNTANIYFDFNPAIVTNTTSNIMVEEFPITLSTQNVDTNNFKIFPNPVSSSLHFSERLDRVSMYDVDGTIVMQAQGTNGLELNHVIDGVYTLILEKDKVREIKKVVVAH